MRRQGVPLGGFSGTPRQLRQLDKLRAWVERDPDRWYAIVVAMGMGYVLGMYLAGSLR